jgi:hypothetical protein
MKKLTNTSLSRLGKLLFFALIFGAFVINTRSRKDGIYFLHRGAHFRGVLFIVPAEFRFPVIHAWITDTCPNGVPFDAMDLSLAGSLGTHTCDWRKDGFKMLENDPQDFSAISADTYSAILTDSKKCAALPLRYWSVPTVCKSKQEA